MRPAYVRGRWLLGVRHVQLSHVVEFGIWFPFIGGISEQTRENICGIAGNRARQWFADDQIIRPMLLPRGVVHRVDIVRLMAPREVSEEALSCLDEIAQYVHGSYEDLFRRSEKGDHTISLFLKQA